jgi:hypothetical protein
MLHSVKFNVGKLLVALLVLNCAYSTSLSQIKEDSEVDFLSTNIKDAYAGYPDKMRGGEFDILIRQVKTSQNKDTFALLSQITNFFKDNHLVLFDFDIAKKKIDTLQCKRDSLLIQKYFGNKKKKDKYEGYWISEFNNCVIAIKKVGAKPAIYHGYVVETNAKLLPGYCMLKMSEQNNGTYSTDYIDADFFFRVFLNARFKTPNTLWTTPFDKFQRIKNYTQGFLKNKKSISYKPSFKNINNSTVLLSMPSFRSQYAKVIDSLIKANKSVIDSATTLILDIRNNGGGFIDSYLPLLPYAYTDSIVHCGGYTLYSDAYIKNYETKIERYIERGDTAKARIYTEYLDSIKSKKGIFDYSEPITLAKDLPVLLKPKNIAIIMNNNCLSAAELMVLNFRQSRKVTLFGEHTGGGVDYLNVMTLTTPRHKYSLSIPYTKRAFTTKEPSYDATGIPPDIEISDEVADWITFVIKYYSEHK